MEHKTKGKLLDSSNLIQLVRYVVWMICWNMHSTKGMKDLIMEQELKIQQKSLFSYYDYEGCFINNLILFRFDF